MWIVSLRQLFSILCTFFLNSTSHNLRAKRLESGNSVLQLALDKNFKQAASLKCTCNM